MSRTFNTAPSLMKTSDQNNINRSGTKLIDLQEIIDNDNRAQHRFAIGQDGAGVRKSHQKVFVRQQRRRDHAMCLKARFNPETDFMPVEGDRKAVNWNL